MGKQHKSCMSDHLL